MHACCFFCTWLVPRCMPRQCNIIIIYIIPSQSSFCYCIHPCVHSNVSIYFLFFMPLLCFLYCVSFVCVYMCVCVGLYGYVLSILSVWCVYLRAVGPSNIVYLYLFVSLFSCRNKRTVCLSIIVMPWISFFCFPNCIDFILVVMVSVHWRSFSLVVVLVDCVFFTLILFLWWWSSWIDVLFL